MDVKIEVIEQPLAVYNRNVKTETMEGPIHDYVAGLAVHQWIDGGLSSDGR